MNLLKFIYLFYKIKCFFSYLPRELQEDAVEDMESLYRLCIIAKLQKRKEKN